MKARGVAVLFFAAGLIAACGAPAASRGYANNGVRPENPWMRGEFPADLDPGIHDLHVSAAVDTYFVVWYDFEDMNWQGWERDFQKGRAGLARNLLDDDPCNENLSTQIAFYVDSRAPRWGVPHISRTPFLSMNRRTARASQSGLVISPPIDLNRISTRRDGVQNGDIPAGDLSRLGGCKLKFTVHVDLPWEESIFYVWHIRSIEDGKAGEWRDRGFVYYGDEASYRFIDMDIGDLAQGDSVQIALGAHDLRGAWYSGFAPSAHIDAPLRFDNVRIERYASAGPQWSCRDIDLFQDNFPSGDDIESHVRADMANDINCGDNPAIRPGDSIVVSCDSPHGGGIAMDSGLPAVYMNVRCTYVGVDHAKPNLSGPAIAGTYGRYKSDNSTWTIIQGEPARSRWAVAPGRWMFDLNDSLFTRGYQIEYYFSARDGEGNVSTLPRWVASGGPCFEFVCLPTKNSDILFVDDFSGRGSFRGTVDDYWSPAFQAVLPANNQPDRYDVNGPSSGASNGPGSRVKPRHLIDTYGKIVWDCGDLDVFTISDGSARSEKSDDCGLLLDWMNGAEHRIGLWICGDNVAEDLAGLRSAGARAFVRDRCGVDLANSSFFHLSGGMSGGYASPLVIGDSDANIFIHSGVPDRFNVFGGCFIINRFDVLEKTAQGKYALRYPDAAGQSRYAGIASRTYNAENFYVKTMWFGFSYMYIRDEGYGVPDRYELAKDVFTWMDRITDDDITPPVGAAKAHANGLEGNFPNPFNPTTKIRYDMKEKGLVTIRIYDVAGRLVRTLVDDVRDAGENAAIWDGRNGRGVAVSSGIYFYEMKTKGFSATKKMILLR